MPLGNNKFVISANEGNTGITRVFSTYSKSNGVEGYGTLYRQNKAVVTLKSEPSFNETIKSIPSGGYPSVAGTDLSSIFFPYVARSSGLAKTMPGFTYHLPTSGDLSRKVATIYDLMPYYFLDSEHDYIYDQSLFPSGDSIKGNVSGSGYIGDPDIYRAVDDQRSVGLRLPAMAVGWGYTTWGDPYPSGRVVGSGETQRFYFKGDHPESGHLKGYQVNPDDYIAAPIDLRYDPRNHVWTAPKGFWAEVSGITVPNVPSGFHYWREIIFGSSGTYTYGDRRGDENNSPAFEVNRVMTSGIVYLHPKENKHYYTFTTGGAGSGTGSLNIPTPTQAGQVLLSISANQYRWLEPISAG